MKHHDITKYHNICIYIHDTVSIFCQEMVKLMLMWIKFDWHFHQRIALMMSMFKFH